MTNGESGGEAMILGRGESVVSMSRKVYHWMQERKIKRFNWKNDFMKNDIPINQQSFCVKVE